MTEPGTIYLVGAGPGDTALITLKGLALLREATAIVGDVVTHAPLLREARPEAELYDTGSNTRKNKRPKAEVIALVLQLARQGKMVVHLWPGDPFVYCYAAEELEEALAAGISVEVVPGVSSILAAPAYAGVPVTHWEYATSFAVVAGHASKNPAVRPNWNALAGMETLIVLMPLEHLAGIVAKLLAAGRAADTPAIAIAQGTLPQQKEVQATLGTIVAAMQAQMLESPTLVVIGAVAGLAHKLAWFKRGEQYPLLGRRVLVTRPAHQAADFIVGLRALGAEPILFPTIEVRPIEHNDPLEEAIKKLARYDWLVLTSANGVEAFWTYLGWAGLDSRALAPLRVAAIGPATATALKKRGIKADLIPDVYTAEGILAALGSVAGQRFLLPRADIARKALAEGLAAQGAMVEEIPSYRTVPLKTGTPPPPADIVTFTSSSTVQGYVNCLPGLSPAEALRHSRVVCIGPITAATAEALGVPVTAVAAEYTIPGLLATVKGLQG
jgi:uroporphyrinogen III methyltransferase/synthase